MNKYIKFNSLKPKEIDVMFMNDELLIGNDSFTVCTLKVTGLYPHGSRGGHIGEYLRGVSIFLREIYELDAMILDFSELEYEWGNNIYRVVCPRSFKLDEDYFVSWAGFFVISSEKNDEALKSILKGGDVKGVFLDHAEVNAALLQECTKISDE